MRPASTFLPGAIARRGAHLRPRWPCSATSLHGAGGRASYLAAAAIAVLAALLEVRGTRIVPQIRRQLPEHWRRLMPMPVAAALYGVLLGIGFTTFVLSFGVWALAGISLALGEPELGLLLGAGFGLGRALPIVALAPLAGRGPGLRANELMCERPGVYLGLRRGDAAALAARPPPWSWSRRAPAPGRSSPRPPPIPRRPSTPSPSSRSPGAGSPSPRRRSAPPRERPRDRRQLRRHDRRPRAPSGCSTAARSARWPTLRLPALTRSPSPAAGSSTGRRSPAAETGSSPARSPIPARPGPIQQAAGIGGSAQLSPPSGRRLQPALRDRHPERQPGRSAHPGHAAVPGPDALEPSCSSSTPPSRASRSPTSAPMRGAAG